MRATFLKCAAVWYSILFCLLVSAGCQTRQRDPDYRTLSLRGQIELEREAALVENLSFSAEDGVLLSAYHDGSIRGWAVESKKLKCTVPGLGAGTAVSTFSRDGSLVAQAYNRLTLNKKIPEGDEHDLFIRSSTTGRERISALHRPGWMRGFDFSPDQKSLITADGIALGAHPQKLLDVLGIEDRGNIAVWNMITGKVESSAERAYGGTVVAYTPDSNRFAFSDSSNALVITSLEGGNLFIDTDGAVTSLRFASDGSFLAVGTPKALKVWNMAPGFLRDANLRFSIPAPCFDATLTPNNKTIACTSIGFRQRSNLTLFDTTTGAQILTLREQRKPAFSPDGNMLATASEDSAAINLYTTNSARTAIRSQEPKAQLNADEASALITNDSEFSKTKTAFLDLEFEAPQKILDDLCPDCKDFQQSGYVLLTQRSHRGLTYVLTAKGKAVSAHWMARQGPCPTCSYWSVPLARRKFLGVKRITPTAFEGGPSEVKFTWVWEPISATGTDILQVRTGQSAAGIATVKHSSRGWTITSLADID